MDRHDREQLLHRPRIGHALKQRKIAEISIGKQTFEAFQLFRIVIELFRELLYSPADGPVVVLGQAALNERQIAEAEQIERRVQSLLSVVKAFEQVLRAQRTVSLLKIDERLLGVFRAARDSMPARRTH